MSQAVYVLSMSSRALQLIYMNREADFNDDACVRTVFFSFDSSLIVVVNSAANVFNHTGQQLSRIAMPLALPSPRYALAQGGRIAIPIKSELQVWGLLPGGHLGTVQAPVNAANTYHAHGFDNVAANKSGSKLAFMPGGSRVLYLFSALNLDLLACLSPSACAMPISGRVMGLEWGIWGWLASSHLNQQCESHLLMPDSGNNTYCQSEVQHAQVQAVSPCGAFACGVDPVDPYTIMIRVSDIRSGQELLIFTAYMLRIHAMAGGGHTDKLRPLSVR